MPRPGKYQSAFIIATAAVSGLALYFWATTQVPFLGHRQAAVVPSIQPDANKSTSTSKPAGESQGITARVTGEAVDQPIAETASEDELSMLLDEGEYKRARVLLMEQAAEAASQGDHRTLGGRLLMLGQIAVEEQDLDAAEVYLLEALEIANSRGDDNAAAHTNMQLGRLHMRSRELARTAGEAYDRLLVARNQLAKGQYVESQKNLHKAIEDNLHIRRYGAAASAYESLVLLHSRLHEPYLAEIAAIEAASLYAQSGQERRAMNIIDRLKQKGMDQGRVYLVEQEISALSDRFEKDVAQFERARDYQRLYRHYAAAGNRERAWKLRVMASASLAKTAKRSLYHRQADVMAVLYDSNNAMEKARHYLDQASTLFADQGLEKLSEHSRALSTNIY